MRKLLYRAGIDAVLTRYDESAHMTGVHFFHVAKYSLVMPSLPVKYK
jgi:hypothetical protein